MPQHANGETSLQPTQAPNTPEAVANASGDSQPGVATKGRSHPARAPGSSPLPAALSSNPTFIALLAAFRRRWFLGLSLGFIAGAALAATLWLVTPQTYTARTLLHVSSTQPAILNELIDTKVDFSNYQRTQLALVKSRNVLNKALSASKVRVLEDVKKQVDAVAWAEKRISADFSIAPEIMRISLSGTDAGELTLLLDAVREAYLSEVVEKSYKTRLKRLEDLRDLYAKYDLGLKRKRQDLRTMVDDLGSSDSKFLLLKQDMALKELNAIQMELLGIQSKVRWARWEAQMTPDPAADAASLTIPPALIETYLKNDPEYERRAVRVTTLEQKLTALKTAFTQPEKEPAYQALPAELELAKKALAACREEIRPRIIQQVRDKLLADNANTKATAHGSIDSLAKLEEALAKEAESRALKTYMAARKTTDMEWLKDEITALDDTGKRVNKQIQDLQVEIQAPRRINPFEDTSVVDDGDKRSKNAVMGFLSACCMAIGGITYLEFRARKVNNPEELTHGLQIKLLGTTPALSKRSRGGQGARALQNDRRLESQFVESIEATRLVLLQTARLESLQVLLLTSAFGGEGKTTLSSHLAVNLATASYRTLLIDADLRRPAVHKIFLQSKQPGLCEVLRGEVEVDDAIQRGPVEGLSLLFAGNAHQQPSKLLSQGGLDKLLPVLRKQYDFVLVDSAPVLPVADSQFICQYVDGVILSVLRGVSRLPAVHAACERLSTLQSRFLGAVVQGATVDSYYHRYVADPLDAPRS
jgi:polysaccharide biosynthesis transport protein